uniref:Proliferating cell nuclear antigen n=1 Tax=Marseillevirus LCMAC103 TaxID=2506604 RepID=A0A481YUA5_9VIRU|nr:MAG: proliferating cell nuclear antigen [Marseillevirus LCMAC103]
MSSQGCLFFAEIKRGYVIKTLTDVLAGSFNRVTFSVTEDGIFLRECDKDKSILFDVKLYREKFMKFKCDVPLVFSINVKHVQRLIRSLKKKDSLILRIAHGAKNAPADTLGITIRPTSTNKSEGVRIETSNVKFQIEECRPTIGIPKAKFYRYPYVIDAADFQKVKRIAALDKKIKIAIQGDNYLSFSCDRDCYATGLIFGEPRAVPASVDADAEESAAEESDVDSDSSQEEPAPFGSSREDFNEAARAEDSDGGSSSDDDSDDDGKGGDGRYHGDGGYYEQTFHSSLFNHLVKLPGLCSQMQFYEPTDGYPLRIKMEAGRLGDVEVYIKDIRLLVQDQIQMAAQPQVEKFRE